HRAGVSGAAKVERRGVIVLDRSPFPQELRVHRNAQILSGAATASIFKERHHRSAHRPRRHRASHVHDLELSDPPEGLPQGSQDPEELREIGGAIGGRWGSYRDQEDVRLSSLSIEGCGGPQPAAPLPFPNQIRKPRLKDRAPTLLEFL